MRDSINAERRAAIRTGRVRAGGAGRIPVATYYFKVCRSDRISGIDACGREAITNDPGVSVGAIAPNQIGFPELWIGMPAAAIIYVVVAVVSVIGDLDRMRSLPEALIAKRARQAKARINPRSPTIRTRARVLEVVITSPGVDGSVHFPRTTVLLTGNIAARLPNVDTPPLVKETNPA